MQTPDKCRHEEVDYSQSLRETLHNKQEAYGRLRTKMREQEQVCLATNNMPPAH